MEKQKRWQFWLIVAVIALTIYNILPTVFYYSKPLKKPIGEKEAQAIASQIAQRVNSLEDFTLGWIKAQCQNLGLKPQAIALDRQDPKVATVSFNTPSEAQLFAQTLFRAGALIPFVPAQLSADIRSFGDQTTTVIIQRKVGFNFEPSKLNDYFKFIAKLDAQGQITPDYQALVADRAEPLVLAFAGSSSSAQQIANLAEATDEALIRLARHVVDYETSFGDQSPITRRFFGSFIKPGSQINPFLARLEKLATSRGTDITALKTKAQNLQKEGGFLDNLDKQKLEAFESQKVLLDSAVAIIKRNTSAFGKAEAPMTAAEVTKALASSLDASKVQTVSLGNRHPFVQSLLIDYNHDKIDIVLHPDVLKLRQASTKTEEASILAEKLNQLLYNDIAIVAREHNETIVPSGSNFSLALNQITGSQSILALDLRAVATKQVGNIQRLLETSWKPQSAELTSQDYPVVTFDAFKKLSAQEQKLSIYVTAPIIEGSMQEGFRPGSLYVIAKSLSTIRQKYQGLGDSPEKAVFEKDVQRLQDLMRQNGFISYQGASSGLPAEYKNDLIFELDDYTSFLLAATRENFSVKGSKRMALLEFTDVEQRIITLNKIETAIQDDLVKWHDEHNQAKIAVNEQQRYDVPAPTENILVSNLKLSTRKYLRGDDRKVLKWGLDLSGGKTVRIGLKDQNDKPITSEIDLRQAVNELYQRVNRLGVSEVSIRSEGSSIVIDFPGSQGLTASELIQASAMYFHVVNEKFTPSNALLAEAVNTFLEDVWNEAVITGRTDPAQLQEIAWMHLGGSLEHPEEFQPLSDHARLLVDNGLKLAGPKSAPKSSALDDTLCSISLLRGNDYRDWMGQTHPLLITFRNYALEGANLQDVQAAYDSKDGNTLHFGVKSVSVSRQGVRSSPRDEFYAWTSSYSEENIAGTPKELVSRGRGWRMAVVLNGSIISAPTLNSALRDSARITGNFSQREVNQLAADLKAGSLSFTPTILSEENVSPDLGKEQRNQGVFAGLLAIALVVAVMCGYYRFGGLVASVAVIFNLLIVWGVLQNLGAALTLPGIAGIILALGMAVDANVLVFERIREEFAQSGRLASAIQAGYKKAFTAIVDSNLTTIIAAVILLNFDAGPIKGFALTLIIGVLSSMFTALFMTRYFFFHWVQNPKNKELKMSNLFKNFNFDFLKHSKPVIIASLAVILVGSFFLVNNRQTIFGMDFTGGYALVVDLKEQTGVNYKQEALQSLVRAGAARNNLQIQELGRPSSLRIGLSMGMDLPGKPFAHLPAPSFEGTMYAYQSMPKIVWIVDALEKGGLEINPASLPQLDQHWTQVSGQLSDTMRDQALIGLSIALLSILVYITFRFEFKYAISATIALAHDLLITLGILAILHLFIGDIQIDLQVIGALMTIVGYSLNDTIIIFDRIREDLQVMRRSSFKDVINHALNVTLGRTLMTSGTTLVVLLALVAFGGKAIFNFSLIMTLGVAIGTLSSLFIASPLLLFFHNRAITKGEETAVSKNI
jgi:SecD/SecF fusion protein